MNTVSAVYHAAVQLPLLCGTAFASGVELNRARDIHRRVLLRLGPFSAVRRPAQAAKFKGGEFP